MRANYGSVYVPASGSATHAIIRPRELSPGSRHSLFVLDAGRRGWHSSKLASDPLQPGALSATSGKTNSDTIGSTSFGRAGRTDPLPRPSCLHATSASAPVKLVAQTWLQDPSKKISSRPVCQLESVDCSTSLKSPSAETSNGRALRSGLLCSKNMGCHALDTLPCTEERELV